MIDNISFIQKKRIRLDCYVEQTNTYKLSHADKVRYIQMYFPNKINPMI